MHAPSIDQLDDSSDYGSDFTPDEEGILNELLSKLPPEPSVDPKFFVKDIEDDEGPRGTRVPRVLGRERRSRPEDTPFQWLETSPGIAVEVGVDGGSGGSSTTIGKLYETTL